MKLSLMPLIKISFFVCEHKDQTRNVFSSETLNIRRQSGIPFVVKLIERNVYCLYIYVFYYKSSQCLANWG